MSKNDSTKTILIIVAIIVGVLLIGGIIIGVSLYYVYKIANQAEITTTAIPRASLQSTPTSTQERQSYQNNRYGFSLKYPSTFSASESQNGDGVTLTANNPAITIRAYGSNNALSQTLNEHLNWSRDNLFQESEDRENAQEILAEDVPLGVDGIPAQERQWTVVPSMTGTLTLTDQVTTMKNEVFYSLQMEIAKSDYDEYAAHLFDEILASFEIQ